MIKYISILFLMILISCVLANPQLKCINPKNKSSKIPNHNFKKCASQKIRSNKEFIIRKFKRNPLKYTCTNRSIYQKDITNISTTDVEFPNLVTPKFLSENLDDVTIKIIDASWYMPKQNRDGLEEYLQKRIPRALYFDINKIADLSTDLPHMLPNEKQFAAAMDAYGITNDDKIVIYDGSGIFCAPRAWWMFKTFGHQKVAVLNGGFPQWIASNYEVDEMVLNKDEVMKPFLAAKDVPNDIKYKASLNIKLVKNLNEILQNINKKEFQLVDARSAGRFNALEEEPRKGIKSGHIPGSKNVFFGDLLSNGAFKSLEEIENEFKKSGLDMDGPIAATCGTGVTASILAFALELIGINNVPVFDGSWTEYASTPGVLIEPMNST